MCEYSNHANFNPACLDAVDDILAIGIGKRASNSISNNKQPLEQDNERQLHQQPQQQQQLKQQLALDKVELFHHQSGAVAARQQQQQQQRQHTCGAAKVESGQQKEQQQQKHHFQSSQLTLSPAEKQDSSTKPDQMSWRNDNLITCMLITANVGTIFEESTLLELWFQQLKSYLIKIKPQLVAIHCQEVGGKNFETSMKNVSNFTDKILGDQTIIGDYSRVRIFLDENFECLEKFTALGSLYLIHDSIDNAKLYNFRTAQYDLVEGRSIYAVSDKNEVTTTNTSDTNDSGRQRKQQPTATIQKINGRADHVEKIKFPKELFPECRWSRKGFMRTRWLLNNCQPLDLVNIHLFHDASNLVAMRATPSPYAQNRQKALEYALQRISQPLTVKSNSKNNNNINALNQTLDQTKGDGYEESQVPLFIFGDFNFRLDTNKVVQRITEGVSPVIRKSVDSDEVLEFVYHRKTSTVGESACDCGGEGVDAAGQQQIHSDNGNKSGTPNKNLQKDDGNCNYIKDAGVVMTVGKKLFDCENLDETFRATKNTEWLLELDNELDSFREQLHEFKISFNPSYPFKEDETGGYSYMKTRCPAWCDRILFNSAGNRIIYGQNLEATSGSCGSGGESGQKNEDLPFSEKKKIELLQNHGDVIYRLMGNSVPMGDHKPVLLYCQLSLKPQNPSLNKQCNETRTSVTGGTIAEPSSGLVESTAM